MNKEQFIDKWNVACDDLEIQKKMNEDLDLLIKRQTDLIEHLQKRIRIAEIKTDNSKVNTYLLNRVEELEKDNAELSKVLTRLELEKQYLHDDILRLSKDLNFEITKNRQTKDFINKL